MNAPSHDSLRLSRATLADQADAIALLFSHLPALDRDRVIAQILAQHANQPLEGLWSAYRGSRLAAAILAQVQSGRAASFMPPRIRAGEAPQTAFEVGSLAIAELARSDVRVAQSLLETDQGPDAELLLQLGFQHVSDLMYLVSTRGSFSASPPSDGLEFESFAPRDRQRLAQLVERTYVESLDCPSVEGVRAIEDVLAGYEATGVFDPARWIIALRNGQDIGCVLLADHPALGQWELVYMGVVPEARGNAYGLTIAHYAQWMAGQASRERLVLAVDAANRPALAMYAAAGFASYESRSVFLRKFE